MTRTKNPKNKAFNTPPLPFRGNKLKWKSFILERVAKTNPQIIIDAYGGSGLISHVIKNAYPVNFSDEQSSSCDQRRAFGNPLHKKLSLFVPAQKCYRIFVRWFKINSIKKPKSNL